MSSARDSVTVQILEARRQRIPSSHNLIRLRSAPVWLFSSRAHESRTSRKNGAPHSFATKRDSSGRNSPGVLETIARTLPLTATVRKRAIVNGKRNTGKGGGSLSAKES